MKIFLQSNFEKNRNLMRFFLCADLQSAFDVDNFVAIM